MTSTPRTAPTLLAAFAALAAVSPRAAAEDAWPIRPYYDFICWASVGRPDMALMQFAKDAVVVAGADCTEAAPCIGRDAIKKGYIDALGAGRATLPLTDQRFDGKRLRTHGETILQAQAQAAPVQLRGGLVFEFRNGQIARSYVELDSRDPQTAAFLAQRAAATALARR